MSLNYNQLDHTFNKLTVLLHHISYPAKSEPAYWEHWQGQPLHGRALVITRGIMEHRKRIIRLQNEQAHIHEQIEYLAGERMIPEQREKEEETLLSNYQHLLKMERKALKSQYEFLVQQHAEIKEHLNNLPKTFEDEWHKLYKQQIKAISKTLKQDNLQNELQELQRFKAKELSVKKLSKKLNNAHKIMAHYQKTFESLYGFVTSISDSAGLIDNLRSECGELAKNQATVQNNLSYLLTTLIKLLEETETGIGRLTAEIGAFDNPRCVARELGILRHLDEASAQLAPEAEIAPKPVPQPSLDF